MTTAVLWDLAGPLGKCAYNRRSIPKTFCDHFAVAVIYKYHMLLHKRAPDRKAGRRQQQDARATFTLPGRSAPQLSLSPFMGEGNVYKGYVRCGVSVMWVYI